MKAVAFSLAAACALVACHGDHGDKDSKPAAPAAAAGAKTFECEKNLNACYVPGPHQDDFLHYADCTPKPTGEQAYGCAPQDSAFCYQAKSLVCFTTRAACDAVVETQRTGSARMAKLAPQSDCSERHASEF